MQTVNEGSLLWQYLTNPERVLFKDGEFLVRDSILHKDEEPTDYSYMVFPYAKLYEGFLKQVFLDLGYISERDFYSTHFRIGKVLSPNLMRRLGKRSVYSLVEKAYGQHLAMRLWHAWKEARNLVFHYFPHNWRALTRDEAIILIDLIVDTMDEAVRVTHVRPKKEHDVELVGVGSNPKPRVSRVL